MIDKFISVYLDSFKSYKGELSWNYEDGCILSGAKCLFEATSDRKYYDFIYKYLDTRINESGNISNYSYLEFNIDNVNAGRSLFVAYKESGEHRFRIAADKVYYQLKIQPRTRAGNFWHKGRYPYQVWLDGLFMAQPFYTEYETLFNNKQNYDDIFNQFNNIHKIMFNSKIGLYYHGYDETRTMNWADKKTGLSSNFWARAVGWYSMALIDVLEIMSEQVFEYHRELQKMYKELMVSVVKYQDNKSGMWFQVLGKESEKGNYLETSASLMFSYSIMKGVRLGYLNEEYLGSGKKALNGVVENYLTVKDGKLSLQNICLMAGLNGLVPFNGDRNGSYEYYISEPVGSDDPKGVGPLMMAFGEMVRAR